MDGKAYDWSEAAEAWANEVFGDADTYRIDLPAGSVTPRVETFEPALADPLPPGMTFAPLERLSASMTLPYDTSFADELVFARSDPNTPPTHEERVRLVARQRALRRAALHAHRAKPGPATHVDSDTFDFAASSDAPMADPRRR